MRQPQKHNFFFFHVEQSAFIVSGLALKHPRAVEPYAFPNPNISFFCVCFPQYFFFT